MRRSFRVLGCILASIAAAPSVWAQDTAASGANAEAWVLDPGLVKGQAMKFAEANGAYTIWGAIPFQRFKDKHQSSLELLVTGDPLFRASWLQSSSNRSRLPACNRRPRSNSSTIF